jgi:hypothetical protein
MKATRTLNARSKDVENVELTLDITESDKLTEANQAILIEAGAKSIGATWLSRQYGEATENVNETMTANDLVEWFVETAGTRGSTKKDLENAIAKVALIKATMAGLGARMAGVSGTPITLEQFQELMTVEAGKLKAAETVQAECQKAEDIRLAKVAEAKEKADAEKAAKELAAKKEAAQNEKAAKKS